MEGLKTESPASTHDGERRRRRRGGRDRNRDSRDSKAVEKLADPGHLAVESAQTTASQEPRTPPPVESDSIARLDVLEVKGESSEPVSPPQSQEFKADAVPTPAEIPESADARQKPVAPTIGGQPGADTGNLSEALQQSGLVMVQTRGDRPIEAAPEPEFKPAKRPRRPPPPEVPMVQVQTRDEQSPAS